MCRCAAGTDGSPLRCGDIYPLSLAVESRVEMSGSSGVCGELVTSQSGALSTGMRIQGYLRGLEPGQYHALTIDATPTVAGTPHGDDACSADGLHFNPFNAPRGPPDASLEEKQVGDLGNILADENGVAIVDIAVDGEQSTNPRAEGLGFRV